MIVHEQAYRTWIQERRVGDNDQGRSDSPESYVRSLSKVSELLGIDVSPQTLSHMEDVEALVSKLDQLPPPVKPSPHSITNYKSAMRQYVAMVEAEKVHPTAPELPDTPFTKPRIYIDTTIISYLTAFPSRDLVRAAHQQVTRDWWATRAEFDLYVSQVVMREASAGDPAAAAARLTALREAALLAVTEEAIALGQALVVGGGLPSKATADALHVAVAAVHGMEYLVSWNCTHIANVTLRGRIERICREAGVEPPAICTPIEFIEE